MSERAEIKVTKHKAAEMLGVSTRTVDRWFPPGHSARSMTRAKPGQPSVVMIGRWAVEAVMRGENPGE
jgi:DNA-binding transcriptional regulator YiaG